MGGVLTHFSVAIILGGIIWIFSKKWYYGVAFGIGHLIPDLISFGITGIKQKSLNPSIIMTNDWFSPLATFSHNALNWVLILLGITVIGVFLYCIKKISKKKFLAWILTEICFIVGLIIHLILDKIVIESNYWI